MVVVLSNGVAQSASSARQAMLGEAVRHTTATGAVGGISDTVQTANLPTRNKQFTLYCRRLQHAVLTSQTVACSFSPCCGTRLLLPSSAPGSGRRRDYQLRSLSCQEHIIDYHCCSTSSGQNKRPSNDGLLFWLR